MFLYVVAFAFTAAEAAAASAVSLRTFGGVEDTFMVATPLFTLSTAVVSLSLPFSDSL